MKKAKMSHGEVHYRHPTDCLQSLCGQYLSVMKLDLTSEKTDDPVTCKDCLLVVDAVLGGLKIGDDHG